MANNKRNNGSNGSIMGNRGKNVIIVLSLFMGETSSHKPHLVFLDTSIFTMLNLVQLFRSHNKLSFKSQNLFPHIILHNGLILFSHNILPYLLFHCLFKSVWLSLYHVTHCYNISLISIWILSFPKESSNNNMSLNIL